MDTMSQPDSLDSTDVQDDGSRIYLRLLGFVRPYTGRLVIATIAMLVVAGTSALVPVLVEPVMDKIFVARERAMLLPIALGIIGLFTVKGLAWYIQGYFMGHIGHQIIADLRNRLVDRLLRQDIAFFTATPSGEVVSRVTFDTTQVQHAVTRALTGIFQHGATIIGLAGVLFYLNWKLAGAAILIFGIAVYPLSRFGKLVRGYSRRTQEQMGTLSALLYETVTGIRVVKIFRIETQLKQAIAADVEHVCTTMSKTARVEAASHPVMEWIGALGIGAVIYMGGHLVIDGTVTTGQFFSFTSAVFLMYDPVRRLNGTWQQIQQGTAAAERIFAWLDAEPAVKAEGDNVLQTDTGADLHFDHVSFAYEPGRPVLHDIDFTVPRGKTVAMVGPSGAGKSTIADLVGRFYDASAGAVRINGTDIRHLPLDHLRDNIAMVDQQTVLFDATVATNIGYGRPGASPEDIEQAAAAANAAGFIAELPEGYDTMIGENGITLSGGQRQRIAIARALLKDAPILILDEATSALDSDSEREVQGALEHLMRGRTALVIAHRLSTIRSADEILVLQDGCLIERGDHETLLQQDGPYRRMWTLQADHGHKTGDDA